ncbi:hypothetical protein [Sphingomonas sp. 28-62-11]|uniref:hypothetical protein n=1 Tax=Sphingomonas sp. 28-62-11 TaxID=1970432 RepID=UPI0035A8CE80
MKTSTIAIAAGLLAASPAVAQDRTREEFVNLGIHQRPSFRERILHGEYAQTIAVRHRSTNLKWAADTGSINRTI